MFGEFCRPGLACPGRQYHAAAHIPTIQHGPRIGVTAIVSQFTHRINHRVNIIARLWWYHARLGRKTKDQPVREGFSCHRPVGGVSVTEPAANASIGARARNPAVFAGIIRIKQPF